MSISGILRGRFSFRVSNAFSFVSYCVNNECGEEQHAKTDFKHKLGVLMRSIKCQMLRIRAGSNVKKLEILTLFCG